MIVPIASDHAGYEAKEKAKEILKKLGHEPLDFGTHSPDSVDYPDFAIQVAEKVNNGDHELGVLICGSGQGMCMTANKYPNVRGALVYSHQTAVLTRQHNNANVLCLPGRELSDETLEDTITTWFNTEFEGGRHERRVKKINQITDK